MRFAVLFVCTGNICRSPMAERLLLARLGDGTGVEASSAGTSGLTGWGMDAPSATALREFGGDPDGHEAQRLTRALVAGADLILTAERAHRDAVVRADHEAGARTFTLREFARLGAGSGELGDTCAAELRARVAEIDRLRASAPPVGRGADDVGDPYGAPMAQVRACAAQIAEAVEATIAALGLVPTPSPIPPG